MYTFNYHKPASVADAVALLGSHGDAKLMAGGQTFIPALAQTSVEPAMIGQVRGYAERSIPADARQTAERVVAAIAFHADVKARQLPALEAWVDRTVAGHAAQGVSKAR